MSRDALAGAGGFVLFLVCWLVMAHFMPVPDTLTSGDLDRAYQQGVVDGKRACCQAVCAADGELGLFDNDGCFCVAPKQAQEIIDEAETRAQDGPHE